MKLDLYQQQIHKTKYARWREEDQRRETWEETVARFTDFVQSLLDQKEHKISLVDLNELHQAMLKQDVLPSMRALMTAGPALARDHVAGYNCAYLAVNRLQAFDEALYILCCGTGVGFSVEQKYIGKLPEIPEALYSTPTMIVVSDSKIGWARGLRELLSLLWSGQIPDWDLSKVRPAGARLKTFGGRASGPAPLNELFHYVVSIFKKAVGRRLTSEECHGIMCKIGDIVVVGGVRRSALISLSDPQDDKMRNAKTGQWWEQNPHYALANNSAVWTEKPSAEVFLGEWLSLVHSKSGERGIFNRKAAKAKVEGLMKRDADFDFGMNPCGEIILRDREFCNLSQITVRKDDTEETLERKVRLASLIGTIQSTLTDFRYLSKQWRVNCEEERLLGVGMTGINDNPLLNGTEPGLAKRLQNLKRIVVETNEQYADAWGIERSKATTCVKPAGNSTELVGAFGSGMHEAFAPYFIRRNRASKTDPVAQLLYQQGVPCEDEMLHPQSTWVFSYPKKSPVGAICRENRTAIERLEHWLVYAESWCEHNPSITISVKDEEWCDVAAWVFKHFDQMIGVTFMPYSEHTYQQAPYEEISREEYDAMVEQMPSEIDWDLLGNIEIEDHTEGIRELACVSGACEI